MPRYHSPKDYLDAANSPETPSAELRELAKVPYDFVVTAVARNPNTEPDILASLVPTHIETWNEQERAAAVAQHFNTPVETLNLLAKALEPLLDNGRGHQMGFQAGMLLCCNPKTPIETISALLQPGCVSMQFRKVVAREARRRDVLRILLSDPSETVRKRAQKSIEMLAQP
jgi:hypothetical protein